MRVWFVSGLFFLLSCGPEPEGTATTTQTVDSAGTSANAPAAASDTNLSFAKDEIPAEEPPVPPPVKRPSGVYQFLLPAEDGQIILHTISFTAGTFRLQEEYVKRDSVVITQGTWAPSAGYIWLYKDQLVRGRYTWQGDTLQYFSPRLKKTFAMEKLTSVRTNVVWQTKRAGGAVVYAIGTEPFWSVEITSGDSVMLSMPDWNAPLRAKVSATAAGTDSTVYAAANDSLSVTVYPLFCSDGMSDFLYTQKVKVVYRGQSYQGCGEWLRRVD